MDDRPLGTSPETIERLRDAESTARRIAARRYSGWSEVDREELVAEVLAKYFRQFGRDGAPEHDGWIARVVTTTAVDLSRARERADPVDPRVGADDDLLEGLLDPMPGLSTDVAKRDVLRRVFALLPPEDGELLRAKYLDGVSARELAEQAGTTEAAINQRLTRAKRSLRVELEARPDLVKELSAGYGRSE